MKNTEFGAVVPGTTAAVEQGCASAAGAVKRLEAAADLEAQIAEQHAERARDLRTAARAIEKATRAAQEVVETRRARGGSFRSARLIEPEPAPSQPESASETSHYPSLRP